MIDSIFTDSPDNFPQTPTPAETTWDFLSATKAAGKSRLAFLYCAEAVQCHQGVTPLQQQAPSSGVRLAYLGSISSFAPNYTAQCLAAKEAGADAMVVADTSAIAIKVASDCAVQGYFPAQVATGNTSFAWLTSPGMDGAVIATGAAPYFDDSTPAEQTYHAALQQYAPSVLDPATFSDTVAAPWIGGMLFAAAATAGHLGGNPTPTQVVQSLYALHNETLGGLIAPLTIPEGNAAPPMNCYLLARIQNHKFVFPNGHQLTCEPGT